LTSREGKKKTIWIVRSSGTGEAAERALEQLEWVHRLSEPRPEAGHRAGAGAQPVADRNRIRYRVLECVG
jgi:hypothetical protein